MPPHQQDSSPKKITPDQASALADALKPFITRDDLPHTAVQVPMQGEKLGDNDARIPGHTVMVEDFITTKANIAEAIAHGQIKLPGGINLDDLEAKLVVGGLIVEPLLYQGEHVDTAGQPLIDLDYERITALDMAAKKEMQRAGSSPAIGGGTITPARQKVAIQPRDPILPHSRT
jgi:hypothetical protein